MRLHCDYSHPAWSPLANFARVFLDGVEQQLVIYADEEHGSIQRYAVDENNRVRKEGELLVIETVMGRVEIKMDEIDKDAACMHIAERAELLLEEAKRLGVVLTVEQIPTKPLAMGNYETVFSTRPARGRE
jgi:hypothetical protein